MELAKDEKLHNIIRDNLGNIAQYISFSPNDIKTPRFSYIKSQKERLNTRESVISLINAAASKRINIRSFSLHQTKGNALYFNKGMEDLEDILGVLEDNAKNEKYSIVNENIDINDGGVSGVALNNMIEFSPKDTPKCVDKPGVCRLPRDLGFKMLETIYGFSPDINFPPDYRVEFSIHPSRQGVYNEHTIIWEYEKYKHNNKPFTLNWPNNFSRFLGDKVYGLLIAHTLGFKVPFSTVISRNVAPFSFGSDTSLYEKWIRTCPAEKEPGKYYTGNKWIDPFELMLLEEKKGDSEINIASIISQQSVNSIFSGGAIVRKDEKEDVIEGVVGKGDDFMLGATSSVKLPDELNIQLKRLNNKIRSFYYLIGEVSIEWVYDGVNVWIVQLNQINISPNKNIIVKGNPSSYKEFNVENGLEALRELIKEIKKENIGIILKGNVGITSHFGDLLRLSNIPSYILQ